MKNKRYLTKKHYTQEIITSLFVKQRKGQKNGESKSDWDFSSSARRSENTCVKRNGRRLQKMLPLRKNVSLQKK